MSARLCLLRDFTQLAKTDVTEGPCASDREDAPSTAKTIFHLQGRQVLRAIAKELGLQSGTYNVRSNLGGVAVSGEVTLHGEHIYIQFSEGDSFMYRSCEGRKDYTGGANHWMLYDDLLDLPRACETFRLIARG